VNQDIPNILRLDNPIKGYSSVHVGLHTSHWPVSVLTHATSFLIRPLSPLTKFGLKTNIFKLTPRTYLLHDIEMTGENV